MTIKRLISFTVIAALVVFSIIAAVLLIDNNTELFANNRDGSLTVTYNNGLDVPNDATATQSVALYKREGLESATRKNNTKLYTAAQVKKEEPRFVRKGYELAGWSQAKGGAIISDGFVPEGLTADSKVTFYAQWKVVYYTINFETNDADILAPSSITNAQYGERIGGISIRDLESNEMNRFTGWYKSQDEAAQGKEAGKVQDGDKFWETKNVTLYAGWAGLGGDGQGDYNLFLRTSGQGTAKADTSGRVYANEEITISATAADGWQVAQGWTLQNASYIAGWDTGSVRKVIVGGTGDVTVTVAFESTGGGVIPPDNDQIYDIEIVSYDAGYTGPFWPIYDEFYEGEILELWLHYSYGDYIGYDDYQNYIIQGGYYVFDHFEVNGYDYYPGRDFTDVLAIEVTMDLYIVAHYIYYPA